MIATLSADRATVTMKGRQWSMTIPVADLPKWQRFYRGMWERGGKGKGQPGPYARFYEPSVKALERVEKIMKAMGVQG